jgi:hypothetical protein
VDELRSKRSPDEILDIARREAENQLDTSFIQDKEIAGLVEFVCRNIQNRAGTRFLLACTLAKVNRPEVDIRKPYTEIGDSDAYSGRTYDERYITQFVIAHDLPCNHTTAFLTPALRNRNVTLTPELNLVGRPAKLYRTLLLLLDHEHRGSIAAYDLLRETIRWLLIIRTENTLRMQTLLANLSQTAGELQLSVETIVRLIEQHLEQPRSSRLPVLVIAAAYQTISNLLGEQLVPLQAHNAADLQTQALGDLEITLVDDEASVTTYEVKTRSVIRDDIDHALDKIVHSSKKVDHYVFITTMPVDPLVQDYAASLYTLSGIEIVILDCVGFIRHFLHFFHRMRNQFLENYQSLLLDEPDSAVSQPLKEVFLVLRQMAEAEANES